MSEEMHRFGHEAMATHFQLMFSHVEKLIANGVAQTVFADIDRLEKELSRFVPYSDIAEINRAEPGVAVPIQAACMDCLNFGKMVWESTNGAFDITIGPLFRLLREPDGSPRKVSKAERLKTMESIGFQHLEINVEEMTVTKHAPGMSLDLGAIGKGYALDQAVFNLKEYEIDNALLNAGDSTVLGIGKLAGHDGWPVRAGQGAPVLLKNQALSGTGFMYQGAHIIDPRLGKAVNVDRQIRWSIAPNATLADALSTAFMVMTKKEIDSFCSSHPDIQVIFLR